MSIEIITDSTSDITQKEASLLNIQVVPLKILFDEQEYFDGVTLETEQFYPMLIAASELPVTSQPSPEDFKIRFSASIAQGNEVVGIFLSSELSGTLQSAIIAKNQLKSDDIYLIDSRTATVALGLLVRMAVRLRDEGHTAKEICAQIEKMKTRLCFFAFVENLKYLKKGGRLSAGAAFAGTLLGIKPVLQLADGRLEAVAKTRGSAAACEKIAELIRKTGEIDLAEPYTFGYTGSRESLTLFESYLSKEFSLENALVGAIGATVGTHAGPSACGFAYFAKN